MKIGSINNMGINNTRPAFRGTVLMNYNKMAEQIVNCPETTQESIVGNIKTLKDRLQAQTPDYKTYIIDFDYKTYRESKLEPKQHVGVVKVTDENRNYACKEFSLGKSGGSRPQDKTQFASGEEIWNNGFKDITSESISGLTNHSEPTGDYQKLKKELDERQCWSDSDFEQAKAIYDKIEDRGRVKIYKAITAATIYRLTKHNCPDEIRESIIGNINTLSWRLENETSKEKEYRLIVDDETPSGEGYCFRHWERGAYVTVSTNDSHEEEFLPVRKYDSDVSGYYYCTTDPDKIWKDTFKPITDGILWDGHHYLPFKKSPEKREIVNKLS